MDSYATDGGASLCLDYRPSLAVHIEMMGPIDFEALIQIDQHCMGTALGACVWIADFRAASLSLADEDLQGATDMLTPDAPFARPIAIVATAEQWELFDRHVDRRVRRGFVSGLFSDFDAACAWADRLAGLINARASALRLMRELLQPYTQQTL